MVVRELMLGPKRFSDLRADLPGISANVLTQRLEGLEANGILIRRKLPPPASAHVYELTPWGYEAEPLIKVMGRWAARSPRHDPSLPLSAVSLMLSFRTMFDAAKAEGFDATVGIRIGEESFLARIADGTLDLKRSPLEGADATIAGEATSLAAVVYGGQPFDTMISVGALAVEGDRAVAERFATLFTLPPKVETAV
ncbi:transcriptional regulator [Agaricicola taiwanensis]|uniref:Transcriptional regulator n=2 Tax=Agaricicola taiwanensis TaxID=591372 RepID=A0A8J2YG62_9RHOB|nr:transcriptional regulator [Agaricicola taiwanensis]